MDFCEMPTVQEFKEVKEKIINLIQQILKKGQKRNAVGCVEYNRLMKALIASLVFRNVCRPSSAIYITHGHYRQLKRESVEQDFSMPLAPAVLRVNTEMLVLPNRGL